MRSTFAAVIAGAVLFAVAFPPFGWVVPGILALVPLGIAVARQVEQETGWRAAFTLGLLFGTAVYATNILWVGTAYYSRDGGFAVLPYLGGMLCMVLPTAVAVAALHAVRRRSGWPMALLLPVAWTSLEVVLEHLPDVAFPWLPLGLALAPHAALAQMADLSGVHGASFVMALVAGLLVDAWLGRHRRRRVASRLAAVALVAVAVMGYGAWRLATVSTRAVANVAVVQASIGLAEKHDPTLLDENVGRHVALTRTLADAGPVDLVLWPETALAGTMGVNPGWADSLRAAAGAVGAPVLFGVVQAELMPDGRGALYNAAMLTDVSGALIGRPSYHKRALVPVSERVPFVDPAWFGLRGDAMPGTTRGFRRGVSDDPFALPFGGVGTLICFESAFPALSRAYGRKGAALLASITNDAALRGSRGASQHLAHLSLRAIESRVGVVRAANTGVSGYVDPFGRLHDATAMDERVARRYEVHTSDETTLYLVAGDWVGMGSVLLMGGLLVAGTLRRRSVVPPSPAR